MRPPADPANHGGGWTAANLKVRASGLDPIHAVPTVVAIAGGNDCSSGDPLHPGRFADRTRGHCAFTHRISGDANWLERKCSKARLAEPCK